MRKASHWPIFELFILGLLVHYATKDLRSQDWTPFAICVALAIFYAWLVVKNWPKPKSDEDKNKTKDLRKIWKNK